MIRATLSIFLSCHTTRRGDFSSFTLALRKACQYLNPNMHALCRQSQTSIAPSNPLTIHSSTSSNSTSAAFPRILELHFLRPFDRCWSRNCISGVTDLAARKTSRATRCVVACIRTEPYGGSVQCSNLRNSLKHTSASIPAMAHMDVDPGMW